MNIEKFLNISDTILDFIGYEYITGQCQAHNFLAKLISIHVIRYIRMKEYYKYLNNISYLNRILIVDFNGMVHVYDIDKIYSSIADIPDFNDYELFAFLTAVAIKCAKELDDIYERYCAALPNGQHIA